MMMKQTMRVDNQFLGTVAGGFGDQEHKYDLRHFVYRTVCNLPLHRNVQVRIFITYNILYPSPRQMPSIHCICPDTLFCRSFSLPHHRRPSDSG